ncbi:uncharacterized protein LOC116001138 [Ipomoea triloba]|uniref:uncharacterized protein LOC116001138 n=1 Tax=Ipomoea triloba TaxID=35885 RepID=UPI00125D081C|nr:uncharacterized protein LOC116001138 [Ipomoea triloba]
MAGNRWSNSPLKCAGDCLTYMRPPAYLWFRVGCTDRWVIELDGKHGDDEDELELEEETNDSSRGSVIGDSDNGTDTPVSTGSPTDLPISSPSDSTIPPTSSSVEGSSIGPNLPIVHVEDGRLIPSHKCSTTMKNIFMQRIYPEGYTWKNIPNEYNELYFEEFKKFYKWDASIDRHVHKAFLAQAGIRYTDMVSKFKSNRTSTWKPACIHEDTWRIWEAYWDRPDVKAKYEQHRKNRMSEVARPGTGCSRHTGGSRSAIEHYHKLRDELQKEPNLFECFEHMHKKKNDAFVDERSKKIVEEIQARHDAATQEVEGST